jgi:inosose dehydratase
MEGVDVSSFTSRVAAAPISWGVCEVPGWGLMLPAARVLPEMRSLGLTATELGAPGFLPWTANELKQVLDDEGMSLVGGFVPLVLHDPAQRAEALRQARVVIDLFAACGATRFVTAVVQDEQWSTPVTLDAAGMKIMGEGLAEVDQLCRAADLTQVLHPHVGTLVESRADVELALEHTSVAWCLDTGHLTIGGFDPVEFARVAGERVQHVHLKDVDLDIAAQVRGGSLSLLKAVQAGLFKPLGQGAVAVGEVVTTLEQSGYQGLYVLEQDTALAEGAPVTGSGPLEDVRASLDYLVRYVV